MNLEQREVYHLKRRKLGITMKQIAMLFEINQSTVSRWETGIIPMPKEYMEYIDSLEAELCK